MFKNLLLLALLILVILSMAVGGNFIPQESLTKTKESHETVVFLNRDVTLSESSLSSSAVRVTFPKQQTPIKNIDFADLAVATEAEAIAAASELRVDMPPTPKTIPEEIRADEPQAIWTQTYAIDPSALNFTEATVTVNATGTAVYKCKEWNFTSQSCEGTWSILLNNLTPGELYTFTLTPDDPGFGEIIAVDAAHLDQNYTFISNIYSQINVSDGIWSEPIYENEIVRIRFAENLTNGRMIDIYASSNKTYAYFDVYEAGTTHNVGRSGILPDTELQYIIVSNLTQPTDVFDFKVVKYVHDPTDNSTDVDPTVRSFIVFDYIHDDVINATAANGIAVYAESGVQTPRYRTWNSTNNNFSAERTNTNTVGGNIQWVVTKANHERDEFIVGTQDAVNDVNIQIVNASRNWTNLLEVSVDVPNAALRAFDIGIEDISGNALIVYENFSVADNIVKYRIWNGTGYSAEQNLVMNITAVVNWVQLIEKPGTDTIMLLVQNAGDIWSIPWNGTNFIAAQNQTITSAGASSTREHFAFEWERVSGNGLILFGTGTNLVQRSYNASSGTWNATTTTLALGDSAEGTRVCADPTSDHIGIIVVDSGNDVSALMWNGTAMHSSPPTAEASVEATGTNNINVDCTWNQNGTIAYFGFVDFNSLTVDIANFTKANTWSPTDLGTAVGPPDFASDDIAGIHITSHPTTNEFIIMAHDILEDITAIRWNDTAFVAIPAGGSPLETTMQVANGAQEDGMFDWDRFDPVPNASGLLANASVTQMDVINITVNVTDNIRVDTVRMNITFPNGSTNIFTLSNATTGAAQRYNFSFDQTTATGNYTIRILANDTSIHNNTNNTETRTFEVIAAADVTNPVVNNVRPIANNFTARNSIVNISANVTDTVAVNVVLANVTYPNNTTKEQLTLVQTGTIYNFSFGNTSSEGYYNVTFIANDTAGNFNTTEKTNFTVDSTGPTVTTIKPLAGTVQNNDTLINVSATVTDQWLNVDVVLANITYPDNATKEQLRLARVGNIYNFTFGNTTQVGTYNITFIANDTAGNLNTTEKTNITLTPTDTGRPAVTNVRPVVNNFTATNSVVNISATVTDNVAVDIVLANVTYPNNTTKEQLRLVAVGNIYNFSFGNTSSEGYYNVTFIANDTANNINSSEKTNFTVDSTGPTIVGLRPIVGINQSGNSTVNMSATVTDQWLNVDVVLANITYPDNTTKEQLRLARVGNIYNFTFANTSQSGVYNVTFVGNDTAGNLNTTEKTNFTIDGIRPSVTNVHPVANNFTATNSVVNISATITDNLAVDIVLANVTYPNNTTKEQLRLIATGNIYNFSFGNTSTEGYYNITFIANDTVSNINSTEKTNFTVDSTGPTVTTLRPIANSNQTNGSTFNISTTVTDQWLNVDVVLANITYPDNTTKEQLLLARIGNIYNFTFGNTSQVGAYNITFIANDTAGNLNTTEKTNITLFAADTLMPAVTNVRPIANNFTARNTVVNISAQVIDDTAVDAVFANITYPNNTTKEQLRLVAVGNIYNFSFGNTSAEGYYNVTFIANDTSNNINSSEKTNFTVDSTGPTVMTVRPVANSNQTNGSVINISTTVTDQWLNVDVVLANITYPGGTTKEQLRLARISNVYNFSFGNTTAEGTYNITFIANDTAGNLNTTEKTNITLDGTVPTISLSAPVDRFNTSSQAVNFVFSPSDNIASQLSCNLTVDSTRNATNSSINNATSTTIAGSGYAEGNHNWNIVCTDGTGNSNTSATRQFTIDLTAPSFNTFTSNPSDENTLDPNARIAFYANITDAGTAVNTVLLQQKLTNESTFANISMEFNASNGLYEGNFTPIVNGTYNFRTFANDTLNNNGVSNLLNLTIELESIWTRTPISDAVGANPNQNISLVNVTINNTGDFPLNFSTTSTFANTEFNTTFPLLLAAGEARIVEVRAMSPASVGVTTIILQTTATANADPAALNTTITLAVTAGQPFLAATFVTIPANATQGDTISINARVRNIGTGNATNGTIFYTLPSDWTLTGGALNNTFSQLAAGDDLERSINAFIPTNAITGARTVLVNTTGLNETGSDLVASGSVSGETRTISVSAAAAPIGAGPVEVPAVEAPSRAPSTPAPAAAIGGEVGGAITKLTPALNKNIVETYEKIYLVRGKNMSFPVNVTNIYNDTFITDIQLSIEGYLAQYMNWKPEAINDIDFAETKQFIVTVAAPGYKKREEHELIFTITGDLTQQQAREVYNRKTRQMEEVVDTLKSKLIEKRHVTLIILETSAIEAETKKNEAYSILDKFKQKGIGTTRLEPLIAQLDDAYAREAYEEVDNVYEQIQELANTALEAYDLLGEMRLRYNALKKQGYDVEQFGVLIQLAEVAFEREQFESALLRVKEAQQYQVVAVEQQFHMRIFLKDHWKEIIFVSFVVIVGGYVTERRIFLLIVEKRLKQLDMQEEQLGILEKDAQKECFVTRKIDTITYHKRMYQYEITLDTIRKRRYQLQRRRQHIITREEQLYFLKKDIDSILDNMRNIQEQYYNKRAIPKAEYLRKTSFLKERIAQDEKEMVLLETALAREQKIHDQLYINLKEGKNNVGGIFRGKVKPLIFYMNNLTQYMYLETKAITKQVFFYIRAHYDALLLAIIHIRKKKESVQEKLLDEDYARLNEIIIQSKAELKRAGAQEMSTKIISSAFIWNIKNKLFEMIHTIVTSFKTQKWLIKEEKEQAFYVFEAAYERKRWLWKDLLQNINHRVWYFVAQLKWQWKEMLLQMRLKPGIKHGTNKV